MIKVYNPKPISEIEELREKGLYNAPFSVLEAMGKVEIGKDNEEIKTKINEIKTTQDEFVVTTYEEIARVESEQDKAIKDLQDKQEQAIVELYEIMAGGK